VDVGPAVREKLTSRVGYVPQDGGLFPHLTNEANVALPAEAAGWRGARIVERVRELGALVRLEGSVLARHPCEISGGQRQRVGLMRALMLDPPVLLLDEPLSALDPIVRAALQTELKRVFNSVRKTVVLVTHDLGEAAYFGHTITLLGEGAVVQHGPLAELARRPASAYVTEFLNAQRPPPELGELW